LPLGNNLIRGKIDLVAFCDDGIMIVDYKSDLTDVNEKEYGKQLSLYYHVLRNLYPQEQVLCKLYYVCMDKLREIHPLSLAELEGILLMSNASV